MIKPLLIFLLLLSVALKTFSQRIENKINHIDSLISSIKANEGNRSIYNTIFADGQVTKKKFRLFKQRKGSGGFAEQYTLQDSILVKLWTGKRIYLNRQQTVSYNKMTTYIFENEKLCYYKEEKFYEEKNILDSLLYEITYYLDNENILRFDTKGDFKENSIDYMTKILKTASEKTKHKNVLIK